MPATTTVLLGLLITKWCLPRSKIDIGAMPVSSNPLFKKPCLIVNPRSNQGSSISHLQSLLPELEVNWPSIQVFETQAAGHATEISLEQIAKGASAILVMGGDGTLNEV